MKTRYNVYWFRKGQDDGCISIASSTMQDAIEIFQRDFPHLIIRHVELDEKDYTDFMGIEKDEG